MSQDCTWWFVAGAILGVLGWEILKTIARVAFNNRITIISVFVVLLAIVGLIALFRLITSEECRVACAPDVSGIIAPPTSQP